MHVLKLGKVVNEIAEHFVEKRVSRGSTAVSGARPKKSWVTRIVIFGPGKFYLENDDVSRRNDCFKRKETP